MFKTNIIHIQMKFGSQIYKEAHLSSNKQKFKYNV